MWNPFLSVIIPRILAGLSTGLRHSECVQDHVRSTWKSIRRFAKTSAGCEPTGTEFVNPPANFRGAPETVNLTTHPRISREIKSWPSILLL
jgi:hypothetical protein